MKLKYTQPVKTSESGFTIVELLIATLVFSIILVVITVGILSFTHAYYKGINSSTTQTTARTIMDVASQAIQFGGDTPAASDNTNAPSGKFCAGGKIYMYTLGKLLDPNGPIPTNWGLYQAPTTTCADLTAVVGGQEMLGPHMRLAKMDVKQIAGTQLWTVTVRVVYGDDDLLCSGTVANSCTSAGQLTATQFAAASDLHCKPQTGSQFCASTELSTTVQQRVTTGN